MNPVIDSRIAYVTVEHTYYGCETGCCGWQAFAYDRDGNQLYESEFDFMHGGYYGDDPAEARGAAKAFAAMRFPLATWNESESDIVCPE